MKNPTIKDIAKRAGVAHSTVSMVMNNNPAISEATVKKVLREAKKLNYRRNNFARALVSGKTGRIAVVIENFTSAFAVGALTEIEKKVRSTRY